MCSEEAGAYHIRKWKECYPGHFDGSSPRKDGQSHVPVSHPKAPASTGIQIQDSEQPQSDYREAIDGGSKERFSEPDSQSLATGIR